MNLEKAEQKARSLLLKHGLIDWTFRFDRAKNRFGCCRCHTKEISLSRYLTELNSEKTVTETILHEIAHALVGHKNGHNAIWKEKVMAIGGVPRVRYKSDEVKIPQKKYTVLCRSCGQTTQAQRYRKIACAPCCRKHNNGIFSTEFLCEFTQNES